MTLKTTPHTSGVGRRVPMGEAQEHAPDPTDRACIEAEASTAEARHQHEQRVRESGVLPEPSPDGLCTDCGGPVEEGRAALGLGRCLGCARDFEAAQKRLGRR